MHPVSLQQELIYSDFNSLIFLNFFFIDFFDFYRFFRCFRYSYVFYTCFIIYICSNSAITYFAQSTLKLKLFLYICGRLIVHPEPGKVAKLELVCLADNYVHLLSHQ